MIVILICFYLDKDQILNVFSKRNLINPSTVENVGFLIFSFYGIPELAKSTILHLHFFSSEKKDFAQFVYYFFLILTILYIIIQSFLRLFEKEVITNLHKLDFNLRYFEDKLFLFSIIIILTVYFMSMNYVYKEIYFLGLIPLLKKKNNINNIIYKEIYNLIIIKFLFLSLLWILQIGIYENSLFFKGFNILIKNFIDIYLITTLLRICTFLLFRSLNLNFIQNNKI